MDPIGWVTLQAELLADCRLLKQAVQQAEEYWDSQTKQGNDASAFQLVRCYNIFENMLLRIGRAFENHLDKNQGWHKVLLDRLGLAISGIRPAFYPVEFKISLRNLMGFRHIMVHAYDLAVDPKRLDENRRGAKALAKEIEVWIAHFGNEVGLIYSFPKVI